MISTKPVKDSIPVKNLKRPFGSMSPKPKVVKVVNEKYTQSNNVPLKLPIKLPIHLHGA